jgi:hypothetical protein
LIQPKNNTNKTHAKSFKDLFEVQWGSEYQTPEPFNIEQIEIQCLSAPVLRCPVHGFKKIPFWPGNEMVGPFSEVILFK